MGFGRYSCFRLRLARDGRSNPEIGPGTASLFKPSLRRANPGQLPCPLAEASAALPA